MELRHISAQAAGIGNKVVGRSHPSTKIPMHNLNENWYLTPPPPHDDPHINLPNHTVTIHWWSYIECHSIPMPTCCGNTGGFMHY